WRAAGIGSGHNPGGRLRRRRKARDQQPGQCHGADAEPALQDRGPAWVPQMREQALRRSLCCRKETSRMESSEVDSLMETWTIHNRINLYLLTSIPDDAMSAAMTVRGR